MKLYEELSKKFKFGLSEQVYHKADTKGGIADLGLLVKGRMLLEECDAEKHPVYHRKYICRMVKFSGSGEVAWFDEHELVSRDEHSLLQERLEEERREVRRMVQETQEDFYQSFGLSKNSKVYLVIDGKVDKTFIYKASGWRNKRGETPVLTLKPIAKAGLPTPKDVEVTDTSQFSVIS